MAGNGLLLRLREINPKCFLRYGIFCLFWAFARAFFITFALLCKSYYYHKANKTHLNGFSNRLKNVSWSSIIRDRAGRKLIDLQNESVALSCFLLSPCSSLMFLFFFGRTINNPHYAL